MNRRWLSQMKHETLLNMNLIKTRQIYNISTKQTNYFTIYIPFGAVLPNRY